VGGTDPNGGATMITRSDVLSTADHLISKDRADVYGPPRQSFGRIGALWGAMLGTDAIPPETVALMLVQLKVSRIVSSPSHEDSWVDLAGYAALGGELATEARQLTYTARPLGDIAADVVEHELSARPGWYTRNIAERVVRMAEDAAQNTDLTTLEHLALLHEQVNAAYPKGEVGKIRGTAQDALLKITHAVHEALDSKAAR
jgi:hypothetical protein